MLRHRLLLGTLLVAALAALCWADLSGRLGASPGAWLFPLALLLAAMGSGEVLGLMAGREFRPSGPLAVLGTVAIVAASGLPLFYSDSLAAGSLRGFGWPSLALALAVIAAFAVEFRHFDGSGRALQKVAAAVLCFVYVGWMLAFAVQLRAFGTGGQGMMALLSFVAIVKMADTGAYTLGRIMGRHKMAPVLSPGKTWEGVAGAILFAVVAAWLMFFVLRPWIDAGATQPAWWRQAIYGAILGIAGLLGDLAESFIKREMNRKDSSTWMPGFGGVLDMIDSLLLAAPVAYLCWVVGLVY